MRYSMTVMLRVGQKDKCKKQNKCDAWCKIDLVLEALKISCHELWCRKKYRKMLHFDPPWGHVTWNIFAVWKEYYAWLHLLYLSYYTKTTSADSDGVRWEGSGFREMTRECFTWYNHTYSYSCIGIFIVTGGYAKDARLTELSPDCN